MLKLPLPPLEGGYYPDNMRVHLHPDLVFVFGSNLSGIHGAGAALYAKKYYGARQGQRTGLMGKCYAIPTKDRYIRTLPLERIKPYVEEFVEFTMTAGIKFYLTPVGTGLAGYKHEQIAPLFKGVVNTWLPLSWKPYLGDGPWLTYEGTKHA
jgi:hypothetical protein